MSCVCLEAWPEDALEMVANKFLEEVELEEQVRAETVIMCKHFHESVRLMSEQYYAELLRHNYVTPTSYLELILTFKKLLALKRDHIQTMRNRYVAGLEKLQFAASQVHSASLLIHTSPDWRNPSLPRPRYTLPVCSGGIIITTLCLFALGAFMINSFIHSLMFV